MEGLYSVPECLRKQFNNLWCLKHCYPYHEHWLTIVSF